MRTLPPLGGVIHSVGVLSDGALGNQSWERFEQVLWPKVLGAWHLHRATEDRDLGYVCPLLQRGRRAGAIRASRITRRPMPFLDQLAAHRRALGLPGQTIAWGAWSELGEAEEQRERIAERLEARGTDWITPQQGLRAFDQLVREDAADIRRAGGRLVVLRGGPGIPYAPAGGSALHHFRRRGPTRLLWRTT